MQDLSARLEEDLGFKNVITILNSGNLLFDFKAVIKEKLEDNLENYLAKTYGFEIPVLIRNKREVKNLIDNNPFEKVEVIKDTRLYVSLSKKKLPVKMQLPWTSDDKSFIILHQEDKELYSVLNLAITKTPKGMETLEKVYGKDLTTRNWNTIIRIENRI